MHKRQSFMVVTSFVVCVFTTAGCAKHDLVKKDEGIAPVSAPKPVDQQNSSKSPLKSSAADQARPATTPMSANAIPSSLANLQSALEKIYFDFDSASLSAAARSSLTKNAALLVAEPSAKIRIEGNCDERGSAEYNLALGERRAKSAQQYLITLGVAPARLATISYGKEKPAVIGNSESAWQKNRRDEFAVVSP